MQFSYVNLFTLPQFFFLNFVLLPAVDHLLRACEHAACKAARFINKYQKFIQAERELEKSRSAKRSAHFFFFFLARKICYSKQVLRFDLICSFDALKGELVVCGES